MTAESPLPCPVCLGPVRDASGQCAASAPDESLPYTALQPIYRCCGYETTSAEAWNEYARARGSGRLAYTLHCRHCHEEAPPMCACCGGDQSSETYATPEIVRQAEKYRLIEAAYVAEKTAYDAGQGGGAARSAHLLLRTAEIIKLGR